MRAIQTLGDSKNYTSKRLREQNNINYTTEYDRLAGELSQTNGQYAVMHNIEQRQPTIKQT